MTATYDYNHDILEALPDQLYILDKEQVVKYTNPAMVKMLAGMNLPFDLVGHKFSDIFHSTMPYLQKEIDEVYSTRQPMRIEHTVEVEGQTVSYETVRIPMFNSEGEIIGVLNSIHNITNYLRIQKELQESRRMFETMVDNANSIILRMDLEGRVTYFNRFAEHFFGYSRDEVIGRTVQDTIIPKTDSTGRDLQGLICEIVDNPPKFESNENENIRKDGSRVWISWSNKPVADEYGVIKEILCVGNDITALKKVQHDLIIHQDKLEDTIKLRTRELQESEARYRYLFEESPTLSAVIAPDGTIIDLNNAMAKSLGYERQEMVGRNSYDFFVPSQVNEAVSLNQHRHEGEHITGTDNYVKAKDGSIRINRTTGQLALHKNGQLVGMLLCGIDVTEEKKLEELKRQHEEEMIQTDKLASLGTLVSGVAHEINNPNNFIALNADNLHAIWSDVVPVLDEKASEDEVFKLAGLPYSVIREEMGHLVEGIRSGSRRIRTIVTHLKEFARQGPIDMNQDVDCVKVFEAAQIIVANILKKSTSKFTTNIESHLPAVKGDFQKIEQVIINLLTNACQALTSRDQAVSVVIRKKSGAPFIEMLVTDEGRGIDPDHLPHIFDPFFTTKRESGGTGLGLSISYGIIKDHKGTLEVSSIPGKGTTFTITLPIKKES
jgi:PAS domain S-box-containing protein